MKGLMSINYNCHLKVNHIVTLERDYVYEEAQTHPDNSTPKKEFKLEVTNTVTSHTDRSNIKITVNPQVEAVNNSDPENQPLGKKILNGKSQPLRFMTDKQSIDLDKPNGGISSRGSLPRSLTAIEKGADVSLMQGKEFYSPTKKSQAGDNVGQMVK